MQVLYDVLYANFVAVHLTFMSETKRTVRGLTLKCSISAVSLPHTWRVQVYVYKLVFMLFLIWHKGLLYPCPCLSLARSAQQVWGNSYVTFCNVWMTDSFLCPYILASQNLLNTTLAFTKHKNIQNYYFFLTVSTKHNVTCKCNIKSAYDVPKACDNLNLTHLYNEFSQYSGLYNNNKIMH